MKHGSFRGSVSLPNESIENGYSPDGLSETDIDALLAESGVETDSVDLDEIVDQEPAPVIPLRDDVELPTTTLGGGEAA